MRKEWTKAKRIVVKIGSNLLVDQDSGQLRESWLASLIDDLAPLMKAGKELIIVSSGAIALGRGEAGLPKGPLKLKQAQAAAATGQVLLAHGYKTAFAQKNLKTAQVLLTLGDTEERRRYLNARAALISLIELNIIPIVNENDTVATNEIRYGDNDRLGARVASMVEADLLVLLSDIDGLYTAPPHLDENAKHIPEIKEITADILTMAGGAQNENSTGGMVTKLKAAQIATEAGCHMVICDGTIDNPITSLEKGAKASWFIAKDNPAQAKKKWIAGTLKPKGIITIDKGAEKALLSGNSLLPAGVTKITGRFERGDAVSIFGPDEKELGRGLVAYQAKEAKLISGKQTDQIKEILGYDGRPSLIHRDNMVLFG